MKRLYLAIACVLLHLPASLTAQEPIEIITTLAGNGIQGFSGEGGPAAQASLNSPTGVAVDANGILYIADRLNSRVRRVEGERTTVVIGASDTSRHRR